MCLVTEWSQHVNTLLEWFRQLQSLYSGVCFCFWQCLQVGYCIVQNQCPNNFLSLWFRQSRCNIFIAMFLKIFDELDSGDKFYSWNHFGVAPQIVPLKLDFTREEMKEGMHGKKEEGSKCLWFCGDIFPSAATGPLLPVQLELCINLYPLLSSKLDISLSFQTFEIALNQLWFTTFYISYISSCVI